MAGPSPLAGTRRDVVAIVENSVSIGLARWIDLQLRDGAGMDDVERMLSLALRQIGRIHRHRQAGLPAIEESA